ncbi:MAG: DUF3592 domain-containing protein [Chloroflexota bacterium]
MPLAILYLLAALWFLGNQLLAYRRGLSSQEWPKATGIIEYAQRQVFALDDYGNLTGVRIIYSYTIKEEKFSAKTIGFSPKIVTSRKMLRTHKPGKKVSVYYSPNDPSIATLETGITNGNYIMMIAALVITTLTVINLFLQFQAGV